MTDTDLTDLLTAANPLTADRAAALELDDAERHLLTELLAQPTAPRLERGSRARAERPRRRRTLARIALPVGALAVVLVALLSLRDGSSDSGSGTAWAAEQIRFAEASPLVLLDSPGWRVEYADEQSLQEGELRFRTGTRSAELNWRPGALRGWLRDRAASSVATTTAPVLGTSARVYQYESGTPGDREITALFRYDGRVLEFRAGAADIDAFKALMAKLTRVDTDTWLSAMPASVIKTQDRDTTIRQMLRAVPLPPGFDRTDIRGEQLTKDRYQLGAAVAGTVACQWFERWGEGRSRGNRAEVREAIQALSTARSWPVLQEMEKEGGYPSVLYEYAAAMPSGRWYGRPLLGDVNQGLGCDSLGVRLR